MSIFIYNTLTGKKDEFIPLNPPHVKMYVCGPTVYDEPHIGHARSAYIFDVIRRYLEYRQYNVNFVRNVTDVDDKIINKAKEKYQGEDLNTAVKKVSEEYLKAYHDNMKLLGIGDPNEEPKATEYINKMQDFIASLINRGVAYAAEGDVYFDIKKAKDYGKLSHQSLAEMEVGARITPGEKKKDPLDFALWKAAKEGEPFWDSPWGKGRPGWHIECSVMSSEILGDEFDIHGGGLDLKFPHHENEIAQSEGAGKKFARYWIHHGLLTIKGQKMSKSLGNFVTIQDFQKEHRDLNLLKLFFLNVRYQHPADYTNKEIESARRSMDRLSSFYQEAVNRLINYKPLIKIIEFPEIVEIRNKFVEAMDDDFNMPNALARIFDLVSAGLRNIDNKDYVYVARNALDELRSIFKLGISVTVRVQTIESKAEVLKTEVKTETASEGFNLMSDIQIEVIDSEIEQKVREREKARKDGNFTLADKIRKEIENKGFIVEDAKEGSKLRKKI